MVYSLGDVYAGAHDDRRHKNLLSKYYVNPREIRMTVKDPSKDGHLESFLEGKETKAFDKRRFND